MVLRVDVVDAALRGHYGCDSSELRSRRRVIALAPGGRLLDDALVAELAAESELTLLCGRYEGFDERIVEHLATEAVSVGRYVLSGGELAAMVVCDAVLRRLPGALGHERVRAGGVVQPGAGGRAGVPALHAAGRVSGLARARRAAVRPPRAGARVAPRAEPDAGRRRPRDRRRLSATIGARGVQGRRVCMP